MLWYKNISSYTFTVSYNGNKYFNIYMFTLYFVIKRDRKDPQNALQLFCIKQQKQNIFSNPNPTTWIVQFVLKSCFFSLESSPSDVISECGVWTLHNLIQSLNVWSGTWSKCTQRKRIELRTCSVWKWNIMYIQFSGMWFQTLQEVINSGRSHMITYSYSTPNTEYIAHTLADWNVINWFWNET